MAENPQNIIRSWNLQTSFATGPVVTDKLVPPPYGRIRTNFVQTWRTQALSNVDWGVQNFSIYLPESLRVVSAIYLKLEVPANGAASYKAYPGLYAIRSMRLLSGGQEVYTCDRYSDFLSDYYQSLDERQLKYFADCYLGGQTAAGSARTLLLPMLIPNSAYLNRNGYDTRGHGVMPCFLGQNRLEVQIVMNPASYVSTAENVPGSISGVCSMLMHQVDMTAADVLRYSDLRGSYSLINRRFTELSSGWTAASANTPVIFSHQQPVGCVTEVFIQAVATGTEDPIKVVTTMIHPTKFKVTADSVTQKDLNTPQKIGMELYSNGFTRNGDFNNCARLCFASHAAESAHHYSGGYNMQLASTVQFEFEFGANVDYRLFAVQLQRVSIDSLGLIRASLE